MDERAFTQASFNQFLGEQRLMGTRRQDNSQIFVPPRAYDPDDPQATMQWVELSGRGRLAAFSVIYSGPTAMIAAGYNRKNPYCAGVVELEEGPKISAQILDVDLAHPETIRIGMPLQAAFVERGEGEQRKTYLAFRPIE